MLFGKLLPREGNFFELFNQHGSYIVEGARSFILLIQNYADPVLPGETAHFTVYTDNPDHLSFFGVMLYPTPVPEPVPNESRLTLAGGTLRLKRSRLLSILAPTTPMR